MTPEDAQNRRRKADALATFAAAVAHARAATATGPMSVMISRFCRCPVAHQPLPAIIGEFVGMAAESCGQMLSVECYLLDNQGGALICAV